jgi:hypothetical protein
MTRILNRANSDNIKSLSYENGVVDGIELLGEIVVYSTILGLGLYEIKKSQDSSHQEKIR